MVHKPPEPEGATQGQGFFILICPLLLLANTHDSFHCKQAMLLGCL